MTKITKKKSVQSIAQICHITKKKVYKNDHFTKKKIFDRSIDQFDFDFFVASAKTRTSQSICIKRGIV